MNAEALHLSLSLSLSLPITFVFESRHPTHMPFSSRTVSRSLTDTAGIFQSSAAWSKDVCGLVWPFLF